MKYTKTIVILLLLYGCNTSYHEDFDVKLMTKKNAEDFCKIQDWYFLKNDTNKIVDLYIYKSLNSGKSTSVSHRLYETWYKRNSNETEINFKSGGPSSPFYATNIIVTIKNKYKYQVVMECNTDREDEVMKFELIKKRCRFGTLYLLDSLNSKSNKIRGFLNIEIFKDNKFKELDYNVCIPISADL